MVGVGSLLAENGHGTDGWKHSILSTDLGRGFGAADQTKKKKKKTLQQWALMSFWASEEPSTVLGGTLTHGRWASLPPPQPRALPLSSCSCLASSAINTRANKKATNKCFQMSKAFPWVLQQPHPRVSAEEGISAALIYNQSARRKGGPDLRLAFEVVILLRAECIIEIQCLCSR